MPLTQQRKKTDLCDVFNLILYFSIKPWKTEINWCSFFRGFAFSRKEDQTKLSQTVINNTIALLTTQKLKNELLVINLLTSWEPTSKIIYYHAPKPTMISSCNTITLKYTTTVYFLLPNNLKFQVILWLSCKTPLGYSRKNAHTPDGWQTFLTPHPAPDWISQAARTPSRPGFQG